MAPSDAPIVLTGKQGTFHRDADRFIDVGDEAVGYGEASQHGKVALGHRKGHIRARRVAPFGQDASTLEDDAGRATAWAPRPHDLAPRSPIVPCDSADVAPVRVVEALRPGAVVGAREIDRRIDPGSIKPAVGGAEAGPIRRLGHISLRTIVWGGRMHLTSPDLSGPDLSGPYVSSQVLATEPHVLRKDRGSALAPSIRRAGPNRKGGSRRSQWRDWCGHPSR